MKRMLGIAVAVPMAMMGLVAQAPIVCSNAAMVAQLPDVREASGLAVSRRTNDLLWTHNDSGRPILYAYDTGGRLRGRVAVAGADVTDWEDLTAASCPQGSCLYIGDIGDNNHRRRHITVYRIPEPAPGDSASQPAEAFHATYPDRPQDAEALFVGPDGSLFIVTKGEGSPVSVYRYAAPLRAGATARLQRLSTLGASTDRGRRVTDGDLTWDGHWVALRTLGALEFFRTSDLVAGRAGTAVHVDLASLREPQGEGLAFARDGTVFLTGEGLRGGTLARLSCKLPS